MMWPFLGMFLVWPRYRRAVILRNAVTGAAKLAVGDLGPCVLYLRSATGDRRTTLMTTGPDGQSGEVHVQPAAHRLRSLLPRRVAIYALWDPEDDARRTLNFSPILSSRSARRLDVQAVAERAIAIVADFEADVHGTLSQGVTWETEFLMGQPELLAKTLIALACEDVPTPSLTALKKTARWAIHIPTRRRPSAHSQQLPEDLRNLIAGASAHGGRGPEA
jgi:hypothetical protein